MKFKEALLVDDDHICNFLHERIVRKLSIADKITVKYNGANGISYISETDTPPDLILLDISMPVMNGFEFISKLKELDKLKDKFPTIVIVTSSLAERDIKAARQLGVSAYIKKPLKEDQFMSLISTNFSQFIY